MSFFLATIPSPRFKIGVSRSPYIVLAVFIALSSCTVGPDYVRPAAEIPAAYKEMQGWKAAEPKAAIPRGRWWEIYNDPLLNPLEEQVNISNQNIILAEAQFRQARALVAATRAGYFPTVTVGASYSRSRGTASQGTGNLQTGGQTTGGATVSNYLLPADATWDIDVWGKVRRSVESSRASAEASLADLESTRLSMQTDLAQDYFQLRSLDAQEQLLDRTASSYQEFLQLTKNRYAAGIASMADVLQAETQLKTTQAQAVDIGVQRAQLEHAIALLIGKPMYSLSIPAAPFFVTPPVIPASLPADLLERRPDIAAAERRMAAANAQIGVAEAAFFPTITLSATAGFEGSSLSKWLTWPSRFWSVGPAIAEVIFEGGLRRALTEEARAAYDGTVASYRQTVLTGFQEVEDNLAALRILEEESQVQEEAVKASEQAVTITMNQYKAGINSYLNVIVAQAVALNNKRTLIDILGRRMSASVLLIKALGGGWNVSELNADNIPVQ